MGGLGSGREDYATTPTVEESRHFTVEELTDGRQPGDAVLWRWGPADDPSATIAVYFLPAGGDAAASTSENESGSGRVAAVRLEYTVTDTRTGEEDEKSYEVPLEYTNCNFGGERPWFRCPGKGCGKRVGKLYCPPQDRLYLCRHCHDLGYRSSRNSGNEMIQAELRYRRAYAKIDEQGRRPHPNSWDRPFIPDRPKGMHRETYDELVDDLRRVYREWDEAGLEQLRQISASMPRP